MAAGGLQQSSLMLAKLKATVQEVFIQTHTLTFKYKSESLLLCTYIYSAFITEN